MRFFQWIHNRRSSNLGTLTREIVIILTIPLISNKITFFAHFFYHYVHSENRIRVVGQVGQSFGNSKN